MIRIEIREGRQVQQLVDLQISVLLGWLNSRSNNPKLRHRMKSAATKTVEHLKAVYDLH